MSPAEKRAFALDDKRIYLWGELRYQDAFGEEWTTKFRLFWRRSYDTAIWAYCDDGNEAN